MTKTDGHQDLEGGLVTKRKKQGQDIDLQPEDKQ